MFLFIYFYMHSNLISVAFWVTTLIRGRHLLEGGSYSDLDVSGLALIRERRLFEALRLSE